MRLLSIDHCGVKLYLKYDGKYYCKTLLVEVFLCDSADRNKIKMKVNIQKYLVIGGGWLLFAFCSYSPKKDSLSEEYDVENESLSCLSLGNMDEHSILDYSDIYDSLSFVKLETNPEALVGRVSKVI